MTCIRMAATARGEARLQDCETQVRRLFRDRSGCHPALSSGGHRDHYGTATNACCESTARSAFMRDYKVVFPSDLNATFDEAMHQATVKNIDLLFGRVVSRDELLAEMEAALERGSG
jgi:hypothetical protein